VYTHHKRGEHVSNPPWNAEGEVSVTFKHDGKYEAPWIVFRGTPEWVENAIKESSAQLLTTALEFDKASKAEYGVTSKLGGTVIKREQKRSSTSANVDTDATSSEQQTAEAGQQEATNPLTAQIAAINTVDDLKRLWAENQEAFKDGDLMDAWKARGKELSK
jgi:hypothetical protein